MPVVSAPASDLLVPPARLAASLIASRERQKLSLSDMELRSGGAFSLGELTQIEAGRLALRDPDLRVLAQAYGIDLSTVVPCRATLIIDRHEGAPTFESVIDHGTTLEVRILTAGPARRTSW